MWLFGFVGNFVVGCVGLGVGCSCGLVEGVWFGFGGVCW